MPNKKTVVPYAGTPEQEAKLQEIPVSAAGFR